jgi:hypothetical protein
VSPEVERGVLADAAPETCERAWPGANGFGGEAGAKGRRQRVCFVLPNVRAKLPAEAGFVSPVRDDSTTGANRAYKACRSGSA